VTIISFVLIQCSHQECQCNPKVYQSAIEEKARARIPLVAINFESRDLKARKVNHTNSACMYNPTLNFCLTFSAKDATIVPLNNLGGKVLKLD
jgi:hypothetical protein